MLSPSLATDKNHMARTLPGVSRVTAAFFQGTGPGPSAWSTSPRCQPLETGGTALAPTHATRGLPSFGNREQAGSCGNDIHGKYMLALPKDTL